MCYREITDEYCEEENDEIYCNYAIMDEDDEKEIGTMLVYHGDRVFDGRDLYHNTAKGLKAFMDVFRPKSYEMIDKMAVEYVIKKRMEDISAYEESTEQTEIEKIGDTDLSIVKKESVKDGSFLQRIADVSPKTIEKRVKKGLMSAYTGECARRGAECFGLVYAKGLDDDRGALEVIKKEKLKVKQPAILKNMNKVFLSQIIGYAAEDVVAEDMTKDKDVKRKGGTGEPDFVNEKEKIVYEVKVRKATGKQDTIKAILDKECKYLMEYLEKGYACVLIHFLYNRGVCTKNTYEITRSEI
jgi:hypothetical protein